MQNSNKILLQASICPDGGSRVSHMSSTGPSAPLAFAADWLSDYMCNKFVWLQYRNKQEHKEYELSSYLHQRRRKPCLHLHVRSHPTHYVSSECRRGFLLHTQDAHECAYSTRCKVGAIKQRYLASAMTSSPRDPVGMLRSVGKGYKELWLNIRFVSLTSFIGIWE